MTQLARMPTLRMLSLPLLAVALAACGAFTDLADTPGGYNDNSVGRCVKVDDNSVGLAFEECVPAGELAPEPMAVSTSTLPDNYGEWGHVAVHARDAAATPLSDVVVLPTATLSGNGTITAPVEAGTNAQLTWDRSTRTFAVTGDATVTIVDVTLL